MDPLAHALMKLAFETGPVVVVLVIFLWRIEKKAAAQQLFIQDQLLRVITRVATAMEAFNQAVNSRPCLITDKVALKDIQDAVDGMRTGNGNKATNGGS